MDDAARVVDLRAWAAAGGGLIYTVMSKHNGSIAIFLDDVENHPTDEGLLAFIDQRRNEPDHRKISE